MSASVCGTGSFSAHTATQLNEREWPMRNKLFVLNYRNYRYCCNCLPQAVPNGNLALFFFIYPNYSKIYFHFSAHTATQLNERERPMRNKLFVLNYGNYSYLFRCTSYINNAADTAAFNDSSSPSIGMITFLSARAVTSSLSPFASLPIKMPMRDRKSVV